MNPGRELDALIAEKVMGWTRLDPDRNDAWISCRTPETIRTWENSSFESFRPSTDIEAALEAVEKLGDDFHFTLVGNRPWLCSIHKLGSVPAEYYIGTGEANTASLAICMAVLKAVQNQPSNHF